MPHDAVRQSGSRPLAERNALVEANRGLVGLVLNRLMPRSPALRRLGWDDAFQSGCLGLIRAADLYDPYRKVRFSTFAYRWIMFAVLSAVRRSSPDHVGLTDYNSPTVPFQDPDSFSDDEMAPLRKALAKLDRRDRALLESRFGIGRPVQALEGCGRRMRLSKERVRQLQVRAMARLKGLLRGGPLAGDDLTRKAGELYSEGYSYDRLALSLEVSRQEARNLVLRSGVPIRTSVESIRLRGRRMS